MRSTTSWRTLRLYWHYWSQSPGLFVGSLLFAPAYSVQFVITPLFIAFALNELNRTGQFPTRTLIYAATTLAAGLLVGYFVNLKCDAELERRTEIKMHSDCFNYLVHQDYDFFVNNFSGSLITKVNRFVKAYTIFHVTLFVDILPQLISVLIVLGIITYYSLPIGLGLSVVWLISMALITRMVIKRMPLRRTAMAKDSELIGELADVVTNSITVKTFASEGRESERYQKTNLLRGTYLFRSWQQAIKNGWLVEMLCAIMQMTIFISGVWAVQRHSITLPIFLLFQVYVLRVVDHLRKSIFTLRQIEGAFGDSQEMTELLRQSPLVQDWESPEKVRFDKGGIEMQAVVFKYSDSASNHDNLFDGLDIDIKSGERVGLVGPSGGGKTTITKLLLRFIDVQGGKILVDGQDIRAVKQTELRQAIAYVPQEPLLFHRTIGENIRYGKPDATDAEIEVVARKSYAHDFISKLPNGYDTLVGERGIKLSGGQRQRVAIARAMLKNALILVLDEATSALDSESEKVIQKALWELMKGRTTIVIAHRLSTIQHMDRIIVLDEGKIVEEGTHINLVAKKGLYARLWLHQSGGFLKDLTND